MQVRKLLQFVGEAYICEEYLSIYMSIKYNIMIANDFFTKQEQEQILLEIVTESVFIDADFREALEKGYCLTPKVVYLAYARGKEWLNGCIVAQNITSKAAKLFNELYSNEFEELIARCLDRQTSEKPNYLIALYINPEKTLKYMLEHGLSFEVVPLLSKIKNDADIVEKVNSFIQQHKIVM